MEERALLRLGHVRDDLAQQAVYLVIAALQACNGPVGREDRALRPEALDAMHNDGADAFISRLRVVAGGVRYLEHDIRLAAKLRHRIAPALHTLFVAVDRAPAMVHDKSQVGDASGD